jgi:hypothetical protein
MQSTFGGLVLDSWGIEDAAAGPRRGAGAGAGRPGGRARSGGGPSSGPGGGFDRQRRFDELHQQALRRVNEENEAAGRPAVTDLDDRELERIDRILDEEQDAAGGGNTAAVRDFRQFGGELRLGLAEFVAAPWGVDLSADRERELRGAESGGTGTGPGASAASDAGTAAAGTAAPAGAATAQAGPVLTTDPSRPLSDGGRPQIDTDDLDLDELAGRLYDRLRSRLRLELLLDRERAGLLTDFR